jgi:hypothetical protein
MKDENLGVAKGKIFCLFGSSMENIPCVSISVVKNCSVEEDTQSVLHSSLPGIMDLLS